MKALAWDNRPEDLEHLVRYLGNYGIRLEVKADQNTFLERLLDREENWEFIVLDLVDEDDPGAESLPLEQQAGYKLALKCVQKNYLVFIVTKLYRIDNITHPNSIVFKSKELPKPWLAEEIRQTLIERGLYVDRKKVFLIYGHDRRAEGTTGKVEAFLKQRGIDVEKITAGNTLDLLGRGLVQKMKDCAAFVAICTPDDEWENGICAPRGNVLLEIGIAMGLTHGIERLIILQKYGATSDQQATLPSDSYGDLTLRFDMRVENVFDDLEQKLRMLKVQMKAPRARARSG